MGVRNYHGHLSGVYCIGLHPTIHVLSGHQGAVNCIVSQAAEPQFISGGMDHQVRLWDLAAGKCSVVLTNHKKSIRALALHPSEYTFCSYSSDHNKVWKCPKGTFERNIDGHGAIINCAAIREEGGSSITVAG